MTEEAPIYMRNIIEKAVSICVIILQDRKLKELQLHNIKHSGMEKCDQQRLESLEEKTAADTSCRHCAKRICKLYSKE